MGQKYAFTSTVHTDTTIAKKKWEKRGKVVHNFIFESTQSLSCYITILINEMWKAFSKYSDNATNASHTFFIRFFFYFRIRTKAFFSCFIELFFYLPLQRSAIFFWTRNINFIRIKYYILPKMRRYPTETRIYLQFTRRFEKFWTNVNFTVLPIYHNLQKWRFKIKI